MTDRTDQLIEDAETAIRIHEGVLALKAERDVMADRLSRMLTIITDSAAQTDRASPVVNGVTPDGWLPPGEQWWESFAECVERQIACADETEK